MRTPYDGLCPMPRRRRRRSALWFAVYIPVFLAVLLGIDLLLALFLQWVLSGFDVVAPFWPCLGAIVLVQLLLGGRR